MRIRDGTVRRYYLNDFRERLWRKFRNTQTKLRSNDKSWHRSNSQLAEKSGIGTQVDSKHLGEAILVYTLIFHPSMFNQVGELLGTITFSDPDLDKLRQEVLKILASFEVSDIEIDSRTLEGHLKNTSSIHFPFSHSHKYL